MKLEKFNNKLLKFNSKLMKFENSIKNVNILPSANGSISASPLSGIYGTEVTLSNTPDEGYVFGKYTVTGSRLYDGNKFKIRNKDVTVSGTFKRPNLTIDLNSVGKEVTSEWQSQSHYPGDWTGLRVFTCGLGPNGNYTNFIKDLGNLDSNFNLLWLPDTHYGTSNSYAQGTYLSDNTQAFYGTCPYGSGLDSQYPRYQKSRYTSTTIDVSKGGDLKVYLYVTGWWYTNILYFAIPEGLVGEVINSAV